MNEVQKSPPLASFTNASILPIEAATGVYPRFGLHQAPCNLMKSVCTSIDGGGDPTTGVRAYYVNGVHDGVVVACVWCEKGFGGCGECE
jgi:hypothetical protein